MRRAIPFLLLLFLLPSVFAVDLTLRVNNSVNGTLSNNFCINATGAATQNVCTLNGTIILTTTGFYNITVQAIGAGYYNQPYDFCYQETANISTPCGGLNTGNYSYSGNWNNPTRVFDADFSTSGSPNFPGETFYMNYTVPTGANIVGSLWQVRGAGWENLSLSSCNANGGILQFYVLTAITPSRNLWHCGNSSSWTLLSTQTGSLPVFEEGVYWNMSVAAADHLNTNVQNFNFSTNQNLTFNTSQSLINLTALQLFTSNTITTFNATNGKVTNTTSTSSLMVPANNGTNNLLVRVLGNYSQNYTCTITAPVTTQTCSATGIYDDLFTIGANASGVSVTNFSVNLSNNTLGGILSSGNTTNGSFTFPVVQGYYYNFLITPSGYSRVTATLAANASTNRYNFTMLPLNSFDLSFYNETTNLRLNNTNVTIQLISNNFANNYSTSNGTLLTTQLTTGIYTIRYWIDPAIPRNYYITLSNQTYSNLSLYTIDTIVASQLTASVKDTSNLAVENATVKLLRYFVGCNCYNVVQMSQTSYAGNAIFFVQATTGYYKWIIEYAGVTYFISSTPEQITTSTRNFVIDFGTNYYEPYTNLENVASTLTYNQTSNVLTLTYDDSTSNTAGACLSATFLNISRYSTIGPSCSAGSTGSVYLTLTNDTTYQYSAIVNDTGTGVQVLYTGYIEPTTSSIFGNLGIFLAIGLLITLSLLLSFSPTAVLIATAAGLVLIQLLGIMTFDQLFIVGFVGISLGIGVGLMRR